MHVSIYILQLINNTFRNSVWFTRITSKLMTFNQEVNILCIESTPKHNYHNLLPIKVIQNELKLYVVSLNKAVNTFEATSVV